MACHGSFPSCHVEQHPDPKSGQEVDPDKPGCITSCQGEETDPTFLHTFFSGFGPDSQLLQPTLESYSWL